MLKLKSKTYVEGVSLLSVLIVNIFPAISTRLYYKYYENGHYLLVI